MLTRKPSIRWRALVCWSAALVLAIVVIAAFAGRKLDRDPAASLLPLMDAPLLEPEPTLHSLVGRDEGRGSGAAPVGVGGTLTSSRPGQLSTEETRVRVLVLGRLARTEVTQVFRSHSRRRLEGTYTFHLPRGAQIARLAMDVNGIMTEGEIVERGKARQIYEGIVGRRKDPALLEQVSATRFRTRIFPIEPLATKTVVIAYEELLPEVGGEVRYRYQLPVPLKAQLASIDGPGSAGRLRFSLEASGAAGAHVEGLPAQVEVHEGATVITSKPDEVDTRQVEIALRYPVSSSQVMLAASHSKPESSSAEVHPTTAFVAEWRPHLTPAPPARADLVFALDTSASIGDGALIQAGRLAAAWAEEAPDREVSAVFGDVDVWRCPAGRSSGDRASRALNECFGERTAHGAGDLAELLGAAMHRARRMGRADVILLSDGRLALGDLDPDVLVVRTRRTARSVGVVVHTVAIGPAPDEELLRALARATGGHTVRLPTLGSTDAVVETLEHLADQPVITDIEVSVVEGEVEDLIAPRPNAARSEAIAVMGRLGSKQARLRFTARFRGELLEHEVNLDSSAAKRAPLIRRFWARAHIGELVRNKADRDRVVRTSIEHGVMSPYTSFLVLENERMYRDHQIERRKKQELADGDLDGPALWSALGATKALVDDDLDTKATRFNKGRFQKEEGSLNKLLLHSKKGSPRRFAEEREADRAIGMQALESIGLGSVGTRGGGLGLGLGLGRKSSSRGIFGGRANTLRTGKPTVMGSMPKEVIRRIVREHQAQLRYCYERELLKDPGLGGKLVVRWIIEATGRVGKTKVVASNLHSAPVERCVVRRVRSWRFPKSASGGIVIVSYPFLFGTTKTPTGIDLVQLLLDRARRQELTTVPYVRLKHALREEEAREAAAEFAKLDVAEGVASQILDAAGRAGAEELGIVLARAWEERKVLEGRAVLEAIASFTSTTLRHRRFDLAIQLLEARPIDPRPLHERHAAGSEGSPLGSYGFYGARRDAARMGRAQEMATAIDEACDLGRLSVMTCLTDLDGQGSPDPVRHLRFTAAASQLTGERYLLKRQAGLLTKLGAHRDAERVRTEDIEQDPLSASAHESYADRLRATGRPVDACRELTTVVQLAPARRELFDEMMDLAREAPDVADEIERCITEGVSMLPVRRELSVLLTWDDDRADLDLFIEEQPIEVAQSPERVTWAHRESKRGGLLYADVREGLGPEVYALTLDDRAQPFTVRVGVSYYKAKGASRPVEARLVIFKNAGAPDEKRTVHAITLERPDPQAVWWVSEVELRP